MAGGRCIFHRSWILDNIDKSVRKVIILIIIITTAHDHWLGAKVLSKINVLTHMECMDKLAISLQTAGLPGQEWIIAFAV
jgi:hypothetical protein